MDTRTIGASFESGKPLLMDKKTSGYILAATGTGKSTLFLNLLAQDFHDPNASIVLVDPHESLAEQALEHIPKWRSRKVCVIDPTAERVVGLSPFVSTSPESKRKMPVAITDMLIALWPDAFLARSEYLTRNYIKGLVEVHPHPSFAHLYGMFQDEEYADFIMEQSTGAKQFWRNHKNHSKSYRAEATAAPLNKIDAFFTSDYARLVFANPEPISVGEMLNEGFIIIVKACQGRITRGVASFLCSSFLQIIGTSAFERVALEPWERRLTTVYIDECHNISRGDVPKQLTTDTRKFNYFPFMGDQSPDQIPKPDRRSILSSCGTLMCGRLEGEDAAEMATILQLGNPNQISDLPRGEFRVRRVLNGQPTKGERIIVTDDIPVWGDEADPQSILQQSANRFALPQAQILNYANRILSK